MKTTFCSYGLAAVLAALGAPVMAHAQTQAQAPPQQQQGRPQTPPERRSGGPAAADDCMTAQSKVSVTAAAARDRIEAARQSNEPTMLRAAVDEALLALGALLAATEPCRVAPDTLAIAGMGHATMTAPQTGTPVSARPSVVADPHAGHVMPPVAGAPAKPAPKPADPRAGMKMPGPATKPAAKPPTPFATDPKGLVCAQTIDPDAAPSTAYKGKTYYFCSTADRLRFIKNPEMVLKGGGRR